MKITKIIEVLCSDNSFSAVSQRNLAAKGACINDFRALHSYPNDSSEFCEFLCLFLCQSIYLSRAIWVCIISCFSCVKSIFIQRTFSFNLSRIFFHFRTCSCFLPFIFNAYTDQTLNQSINLSIYLSLNQDDDRSRSKPRPKAKAGAKKAGGLKNGPAAKKKTSPRGS